MQSGDTITAMSIDEAGQHPVYGGNGLRGYTASYTHDGDFVLIGRQGALCGNVHLVHGRFWASEHAVVATLHVGHVPYWFGALLRGMNLNQYSIAAAQPGLSVDRVLNLWAPVPPKLEQTAIARFLNHADRRIQRYIRAKERLIELLEEQKQAIIHQAVTGQIDVRTGQPYPAYKNSDVEGLREVPEHWDVVALRHLATKFGSGITPRGGATIYETKGIPFLRSQNVHFDGLRLEGLARIPHEVHMTMKGTHVKPGDVLLNITGAIDRSRVCRFR